MVDIEKIASSVQYFVVKNIYGDHNDARNVRQALKMLLQKRGKYQLQA